jgi:DNA-binding protein HU-beta
VTKADIIDRIANGTGLTKIETEAVINGLITTVKDALLEGERIDLRGFGAFQVQYRAPRIARNPQTNKEIPLEAQYVPVFKASKELRQAVDAAQKAAAPQS